MGMTWIAQLRPLQYPYGSHFSTSGLPQLGPMGIPGASPWWGPHFSPMKISSGPHMSPLAGMRHWSLWSEEWRKWWNINFLTRVVIKDNLRELECWESYQEVVEVKRLTNIMHWLPVSLRSYTKVLRCSRQATPLAEGRVCLLHLHSSGSLSSLTAEDIKICLPLLPDF